MSKTRCKFRVDNVVLLSYCAARKDENGSWKAVLGVPAEQVNFAASYSGTQEDNEYSSATPSGTMSIQVNNADVCGKFRPGDEVYIDITKIEKA